MLMDLEKETGRNLIDEDSATLLLTGLVTDTGSFQHSNTTPEAFEVAADLLDRGARQQEIIKHIYKTKSLATLKLWGRVLSKMVSEGPLVYSTVTVQDLLDTGANSEDTGGIIDELMASTPGAEVVVLLKEKEPGFISGSMRAPGHLADVSAIAGELGGGGHKKAAGFRIKDRNMEDAIALVKQAVFGYLLKVQPASTTPADDANRLFPGLAARPTSLPKPEEGGEDMLLEDFKKRQTEVPANADPATRFFQDADGQQPTVGDVLGQ
jgi:phosphoesterase RecJ-like protein